MATNTTTAGVGGILPEQWVGPLIVDPVIAESVALNPAVTTSVTITGNVGHIPIVREDAGAAWVAEGAEIIPDDGVFDELEVSTCKVAGMSVASNEMIADSSPEALQLVGAGIARQIAQQIDRAFFTEPALSSPAPAGLGSLTGITTVSAGSAFTSLDPFADAVSAAELLGVTISSWVANPADLLTLSKLKVQSGSQLPLLGTDATQPTRRVIQGRPVLTSPFVKAGHVWGMPQGRVIAVRRQDV